MTFVVHAAIAATPAEVFDRMADARNETHWNSQVSSSELVSDGPVGRGSVFRTVNRGKLYKATIRTYEKPRLLVFDVTGSAMDITASFTFQDDHQSTLFTGEFDMRPKGFLKAIFALMQPLIRRDLTKQSRSFKTFCESS